MLRDFTKIETFLAVVKEKSFSKASKKLGISQPAVTQQIKLLEEYLDTKIVDRKKNGIRLTKEGEEFYKVVIKLEKCIANAEKDVIKIINKEMVFIIGASFMIGNYILPDFLTEIQHAIKNDVMIKVDDSESITEELMNKKVDLALLESPTFEEGLIYREWMDDELVVVSRSPIPKLLRPDELNDYNWICREESSNTRKLIKAEFEKIGIDCSSFDMSSVVTSSTAAKQTILKSPIIDGVPTLTILSKHMIEHRAENQELYYARVKGLKLARKLYITYPKDKKLDPFLDRVVNYITSKRRV